MVHNTDFDLKKHDVITDFLDWIYSIPENHLFKYHYNEAEDDFFGVECYPVKLVKRS